MAQSPVNSIQTSNDHRRDENPSHHTQSMKGVTATAICAGAALSCVAIMYRSKLWAFVPVSLDVAAFRLKYRLRDLLEVTLGSKTAIRSLPGRNVSAEWLEDMFIDSGILPTDRSIKVTAIQSDQDGLAFGYVGEMSRLNVSYSYENENNENLQLPQRLVMKQHFPAPGTRWLTKLGSSYREATFYAHCDSLLGSSGNAGEIFHIPRIYYSAADPRTGECCVIMEDLSINAFRASEALGNQFHAPARDSNDWEVLDLACVMAADFHGRFWRDESLKKESWLKCTDWVAGYNSGNFRSAHENMRMKWEDIKRERVYHKVHWSPVVVRCIDDLYARSSWAQSSKEWKNRPFTLAHGDFHASNMMVRKLDSNQRLNFSHNHVPEGEAYFVDWSEVGLSDGITDIAQFLVSNAPIEKRREEEKRLVSLYWHALIASGRVQSSEYSLETCWKLYRMGGVERWTQLLIILAWMASLPGSKLTDESIQWFHDQVLAFLDDHYHGDVAAECCFMTTYVL